MLVKILNNKPIGYIKADESVLNSEYLKNQKDLIQVPDIEITEDIKYYEIVDNTLKLVSNYTELKEAEAEAKAEAERLEEEAARLKAEAEKPTLEEPPIPNISLRQCKELLILTGKYDNVISILENMPETTPEEITMKKVLTNYWENSQEFERSHKSLGLITTALGMSEDEVDNFFLEASKL